MSHTLELASLNAQNAHVYPIEIGIYSVVFAYLASQLFPRLCVQYLNVELDLRNTLVRVHRHNGLERRYCAFQHIVGRLLRRDLLKQKSGSFYHSYESVIEFRKELQYFVRDSRHYRKMTNLKKNPPTVFSPSQPVREKIRILTIITRNMNVVPHLSWIVDIFFAFSTVRSSPCS